MMTWYSTKPAMPSGPPSRPIPDCLNPPNGLPKSSTAVELIATDPACTRASISKPSYRLTSATRNKHLIVPLQCLHGLTFGATQLGAMAAVSAYDPDGARGRAQGTLSAVNASISVVATLVSGFAYRAGGPLAFLAMAPLAAAGLGLALASRSATSETDRQP